MKNLTPAKVTMMMFVAVGVLVAAYIAKSLLAVDAPPPKPAPATRRIPLAVTDIEPGTVITDKHLGQGSVEVNDIAPETLLHERIIIGRVAKKLIQGATPIKSSDLYGPDEYPPLEVKEGMRAVSVDLSPSFKIVDGLIKPGQHVDIHLTTSQRNDPRTRGGLTLTLFKGVRILTINRTASQPRVDQGGNTVTLELTPKQANIMILARSKGEITLTYNPDGENGGGVTVSSDDRATLEEILGLKPLPKPEQPFQTEIYRGTNRAVLRFKDGKNMADSFDSSQDQLNQPLSPYNDRSPSNNDSDNNKSNDGTIDDGNKVPPTA